MSETRKISQPTQEGVEQVREAAQAAIGPTARTSKEAANRGQEAFNRMAHEARNVGSTVADSMAGNAEATADIARRSVEQSREVAWLGMRAAFSLNERFADASSDAGHRMMESTARALDIYRQACESAAENGRALFESYQRLGHGLQEMQVAYVQILDRAMQQSTRKPQDLLRAKSIEEFAEVQRRLYVDAVDLAVEASSTLLQLAGRVVQQAVPHPQNASKVMRP